MSVKSADSSLIHVTRMGEDWRDISRRLYSRCYFLGVQICKPQQRRGGTANSGDVLRDRMRDMFPCQT